VSGRERRVLRMSELTRGLCIPRWMMLLVLLCLHVPLSIAAAADTGNQHYVEGPNPLIENFLNTPYRGDLFDMLQRGAIRVAVTYSKTHYFIDQGKQYGITSETLQAFETYLRGRFKSRLKGRSLAVIFLPVPRDQLFPMLESGLADMAVANLTITPARQARADFTLPIIRHVSEIVVSNSEVPTPASLEGFAGKQMVLRKSSSFYQHLLDVNKQLQAQGKRPIKLMAADEYLENEDLLEMLDAGLIDYTVVDAHIANLWAQIFPRIRVHPDLVVKEGGQIAWAVRKGTPQLLAEANRFLKKHRSGTEFGNIMKKRYLENPYWAKRALDQSEITKFNQVVDLFRKYADRYQFDYLMLMAQGYQESQLNQSMRSPVGAVGIMQLMPTTAKSLGVGDIGKLENNVHAGTKYLRHLIDHYFSDPEIDEQNRILFAFAAYNSGPTRIQKMRRRTARNGLNPNVWFGNVEYTVARYVGREPVRYVSNIAKYYVAYRMVQYQSEEKAARKQSASGD